ncbi:hypothetical protein F4781DRAFT_431670 [Annulohypoxylon bovei var. microspora]|nr:hypothetical protein F4781DRAFT_431670 [Annulohypoxylon bovei var. microspora]
MDPSVKRKHPGSNNRPFKKSKGGANGRWQTPHQKTKLEALRAKGLEPGDVGLSTTCVKGKERQALEELLDICEEYGETLFNLKAPDPASGDEAAAEDIESSIKKEVQGLKPSKDAEAPFEPIRLELDCLLFMRTRDPVDPVALAHRICADARDGAARRRSRFVNRFTPVTASARATEAGLDEVARKVLGGHFRLAGGGEGEGEDEGDACSYAIRPTFRAHNLLKRESVIKKVAELIAPCHKVNLTAPDKVVLIEVYQTFCGMSVVDGDWDSLKRYNLHEIYMAALKAKGESAEKAKGEEEKEKGEEKAKEEEEKAQTEKPET